MDPQTRSTHSTERPPWDAPALRTLSVGDSEGPPPKDFVNAVELTFTDGNQYHVGPS